jgi:hypothetical protein
MQLYKHKQAENLSRGFMRTSFCAGNRRSENELGKSKKTMDKEVAGAHNALRCVHTKTAQEL